MQPILAPQYSLILHSAVCKDQDLVATGHISLYYNLWQSTSSGWTFLLLDSLLTKNILVNTTEADQGLENPYLLL